MIGIAGSGERKNPYPFSFLQHHRRISVDFVVSTSITPTGYDGALTATVSGSGSPGVRKNSSGSFGSSVVLFPGDVLNLQLTSSSSYNTATVVTIAMGTLSASWSVTTAVVTPGSQNFTTPGTFNFVPPVFNTMTVTVKGAGQAGGDPGSYSLSGGKRGICLFHPGGQGANGTRVELFGPSPSLVGPGGTSAGNGTGSGGNSINDFNGGAGGAGGTGTTDPDCGATGDGAAGSSGGRAVSTFSVGGLTVGANYTVVVGSRGAFTSGFTAAANGSVTISWT